MYMYVVPPLKKNCTYIIMCMCLFPVHVLDRSICLLMCMSYGARWYYVCLFSPYLSLHVVFGHVIQGKQYVAEIENQKVDANHRPYADVRISNCGELVLLKGTRHRWVCNMYNT